MSTHPTTSRRLVRTIVCAYARAELPTSWLQVFHRFERTIERSGLRVRVRLDPLEEMPERFDVVVATPELAERAAALASGAVVLTTTRRDAAATATELVRELEDGTSLYAERAQPDDPVVVKHRGNAIL